jgi:hypothetical protein
VGSGFDGEYVGIAFGGFDGSVFSGGNKPVGLSVCSAAGCCVGLELGIDGTIGT